jgi:predicted nucleotidyltransferase
MPDIYQQLLDRARRVASIYGAHPQARAVIVVGSLARGQYDAYSDIDMTVFYERMPTDDEIRAGREAAQAAEWMRFPGGEADEFADSFLIDGVECQVIHCTIARIERDLNAVLHDYSTNHEQHVIVGGIAESLALYGAELAAEWQRRCQSYPDALAQAMVREHMRFAPFWVFERRLPSRDAPLFMRQYLIDQAHKLLAALSGLNRLYPQLHFKRIDAYAARMRLAPPQLAKRIKHMLGVDDAIALGLLRELIWETFDLIAQHMPEVDLAAARQRFDQPPRALATTE